MEENTCILYNPSLAKEITSYGVNVDEAYKLKEQILLNNKIYVCGKTFIVTKWQLMSV